MWKYTTLLCAVGVFLVATALGCSPTASAPAVPPTPTAVPAPTVPLSPWSYKLTDPDPVTGVTRQLVSTVGQIVGAHPHASLYDRPILVLRCSSDERELDAMVHWGGRFLADNVRTDRIEVTYKVDDQPPQTRSGNESANNEAVFMNNGRLFAHDLLDANNGVIRVANYDGTEMTAQFEIAGLQDQRENLPCWY